MAAAASSPTFTTPQGKKNDVFLSFRGADTRKTFTSHIHSALRRRSIQTYIDYDLEQGDEISTLLTEIENSAISVVIFSANYASSKWCLSEIVKIIECKEKFGQIVIPVFYDVFPSDIKYQKRTFEDAFSKHEERYKEESVTLEMLQKARKALSQAANIKGFDSNTGTEAELVEKIAQHILIKLISISDHQHKDLIGVKSSIEKVESLLNVEKEKNNCLVGIWGMGGMGKTTIARAVFDKISHEFDNSYFADVAGGLNDPREIKNHIKHTLLPNLISLIVKNPNADIYLNLTENILGRAKVLIVLDDVWWEDQLYKFVKCLGSGSRIIMTTRDKKIFERYRVDINYIYRVEELSKENALKLFSWSAFEQDHPRSDYLSLTERVVEYANGVPFALKELGTFLHNKGPKAWESEIKKLQKFPHKEIQEVLLSSYEDLDERQQSIFLDIAFFFKCERIDLVTKFLDASGSYPGIDISVLIEKSLLTILGHKIKMNNLLQAMGREIVRQESPKFPEERSRLCCHEEIIEVLVDESGTKSIRGLSLDMSKVASEIHLGSKPEALHGMTKLELFKLHNKNCEESKINKLHDFQGLKSNKLRYICWHGFPSKSLHQKFCSENLVALDIPHSHFEELWPGDQNFENLKHVNLSHSKHLVRIKDLSCSPNLESLILEGCTELREFPSCIEHLSKLVTLDLRGCSKLDQNELRNSVKERLGLHDHGIPACYNFLEYNYSNDEMNIEFLCGGCEDKTCGSGMCSRRGRRVKKIVFCG